MVFTARLAVTISGAIHPRAWTGFPLRCLLFHIRFPFRVPPLSYKYCAPFYAFPIVIKFREMCQKYRCKAEKSIFPTDSSAFLCQYAIVCTGLVPNGPESRLFGRFRHMLSEEKGLRRSSHYAAVPLINSGSIQNANIRLIKLTDKLLFRLSVFVS